MCIYLFEYSEKEHTCLLRYIIVEVKNKSIK